MHDRPVVRTTMAIQCNDNNNGAARHRPIAHKKEDTGLVSKTKRYMFFLHNKRVVHRPIVQRTWKFDKER